MKSFKSMLKAALPVVLGIGIFAVIVKYAVEYDVPFIKDLREAFDA